jgi:hypothetical protein
VGPWRARWRSTSTRGQQTIDKRSRSITALELIHALIRGLHEALAGEHLLQQLPRDVVDTLTLAYGRTSRSITMRSTVALERNVGLPKISAGIGSAKLTFEGVAKGKSSRTSGTDETFFAFDQTAAEAELIHLFRLLNAPHQAPDWKRRFALAAFLRIPSKVRKLKVVFVLDELDKQEVGRDQSSDVADGLAELIGPMKTLLAESGVTFLFVVGKELHQRLVQDVERGDSIYESIFASDRYLTCLWGSAVEFCHRAIDEDTYSSLRTDDAEQLGLFVAYLDYWGRGNPRTLIKWFDKFITWPNNQPTLVVRADVCKTVRAYGELQRLLQSEIGKLLDVRFQAARERGGDELRLNVYRLIDWMMRHQDREFTANECSLLVEEIDRRTSVDSGLTPVRVQHLLNFLVKYGYVKRAVSRSARNGYSEAFRPTSRLYGAPENPPDDDAALVAGVTRIVQGPL